MFALHCNCRRLQMLDECGSKHLLHIQSFYRVHIGCYLDRHSAIFQVTPGEPHGVLGFLDCIIEMLGPCQVIVTYKSINWSRSLLLLKYEYGVSIEYLAFVFVCFLDILIPIHFSGMQAHLPFVSHFYNFNRSFVTS